jgi:hypothetical protein
MLTKRNKIFFVPLFITMLLASCHKYEVRYDGAYDDAAAVEPTSIDDSKGIIYVESGKLYMASAALNRFRSYSLLPTDIRYAAINNAHDKIAYKTISGNITVIDTFGNKIATIDNSSASTIFDWHSNNNTLCYLDNLKINFYGPSVDVAISDFNTTENFPANTLATSKKVLGFAVKENGSVLYWIQYYLTSSGWTNEFIYHNKNGTVYKDKTNLPLVAITSWMRLSSKSDNAYFGFFNSTTGSNFNTYSSKLSYSKISISGQSGNLFVQSPGGFGTCYSTSNAIYVNLYDKTYQKSVIGSNVTALDW